MIKKISILLFYLTATVLSQTDSLETKEIYVIDSFITQEKPYKFTLSFFTDDEVKSEVIINDQTTFNVSEDFSFDHKAEIPLSKVKSDSTVLRYFVILETAEGEKFKSETFEVEAPVDAIAADEINPSLFKMCIGGVIFLLPQPTLARYDRQNYFSLAKELPLVTFYSGGRNYPTGYLSLEYAYIFDVPKKNFLHFGYKQIFEIPTIEYVSLGVSGFTDFLGYNGVSPEVSLGLFKAGQIFTVYLRYRYNFQPNGGKGELHEISIGLFSHFFSLNF